MSPALSSVDTTPQIKCLIFLITLHWKSLRGLSFFCAAALKIFYVTKTLRAMNPFFTLQDNYKFAGHVLLYFGDKIGST